MTQKIIFNKPKYCKFGQSEMTCLKNCPFLQGLHDCSGNAMINNFENMENICNIREKH